MIYTIKLKTGETINVTFELGSFDFHADYSKNISNGVTPCSIKCLSCGCASDTLVPLSYMDESFNEYPLDEGLCPTCAAKHAGVDD